MSKHNGSRAVSLAAQFKDRAQASRIAVELSVPLPNDPRFVFSCVVRRIDVITLVTSPDAGLPEHFVSSILGVKAPDRLEELQQKAAEIADETTRQMTVADLQAIQRFQRKVAQETCLEPRIVFEETDDEGAINLSDPAFAHCAQEIVSALYNYGMRLSPDVPVKMRGDREASLESIQRFPVNPALPGDLHDGSEIPQAAEQDSRSEGQNRSDGN
jgi:hypothetical protein